ncbi:MAG: hypothetical protein AB7R69_00825 [Candidatus Babeliales bacterium]
MKFTNVIFFSFFCFTIHAMEQPQDSPPKNGMYKTASFSTTEVLKVKLTPDSKSQSLLFKPTNTAPSKESLLLGMEQVKQRMENHQFSSTRLSKELPTQGSPKITRIKKTPSDDDLQDQKKPKYDPIPCSPVHKLKKTAEIELESIRNDISPKLAKQTIEQKIQEDKDNYLSEIKKQIAHKSEKVH